MRPDSTASGEGDLSSLVAFSILFIVPAGLAVLVWIVLRILEQTVGITIGLDRWFLALLAPALACAAIAQWVCRRAKTGAMTAFGFSIASSMVSVLFTVFASAWLVTSPFGD